MNFINNKLIGDLEKNRGRKCNVKPLKQFPIIQGKYFFKNNRNHPILPVGAKQNFLEKCQFKRPLALRGNRKARNASHINLSNGFFGGASLVGTPFLLQSNRHASILQRTCSEFDPKIMSTPLDDAQKNAKTEPEKGLKEFCDATCSEVSSCLAILFNKKKPVLNGFAQRLKEAQQNLGDFLRKELPKPLNFSLLENNSRDPSIEAPGVRKRLCKRVCFENDFETSTNVQPRPTKRDSSKSNFDFKRNKIAQQVLSWEMDCSLSQSDLENDCNSSHLSVMEMKSHCEDRQGIRETDMVSLSNMTFTTVKRESSFFETPFGRISAWKSHPNRVFKKLDMTVTTVKQESPFFESPFRRSTAFDEWKSHPNQFSRKIDMTLTTAKEKSSFFKTPFWCNTAFEQRQSHPNISSVLQENRQKLKNDHSYAHFPPPSPMSFKLQNEVFPSSPCANKNTTSKNLEIEKWCQMTRNIPKRKPFEDLRTNHFENPLQTHPTNLREILDEMSIDTTLTDSAMDCDLDSPEFMDWTNIFDSKENDLKIFEKRFNRTDLHGKIPFELDFDDLPTSKCFSPTSFFSPMRKTIDGMRINRNRSTNLTNRFKRVFLNSGLSDTTLPAVNSFNIASPISSILRKRKFNEIANESILNSIKQQRLDEARIFLVNKSKKLFRNHRFSGLKFDDSFFDVE